MPRDKTGHFYFEWYCTIYKADTQHLTLAEDGAYRRLIDYYMETRAPLPDDDRSLARIIGIGGEEWNVHRAAVLKFFKPSTNPLGYLTHSFCDEVLRKHASRITKSRTNGGKGGRPNKLKSKANNPAGYESITQRKPITEHQHHTDVKNITPLPPLEPKTVDNSAHVARKLSKNMKNINKNDVEVKPDPDKPYDILSFFDEIEVSVMKSLVPDGYRFDVLVRTFNRNVNKGLFEAPIDPQKAFPKWIKTYTRGKPPPK